MRLDSRGRLMAGEDARPYSRPDGGRDYAWWTAYDAVRPLLRPDTLGPTTVPLVAGAIAVDAPARWPEYGVPVGPDWTGPDGSADTLAGHRDRPRIGNGVRAKSARRYRFGGDLGNPERVRYLASMIRLGRCQSLRVRADGTPTADATARRERAGAGDTGTGRLTVVDVSRADSRDAFRLSLLRLAGRGMSALTD